MFHTYQKTKHLINKEGISKTKANSSDALVKPSGILTYGSHFASHRTLPFIWSCTCRLQRAARSNAGIMRLADASCKPATCWPRHWFKPWCTGAWPPPLAARTLVGVLNRLWRWSRWSRSSIGSTSMLELAKDPGMTLCIPMYTIIQNP